MKHHYVRELWEQPAALSRTVRELAQDQALLTARLFVESSPIRTVILTGMGSSLAAAHYGAYLLNQDSINAFAMETGELLHYSRGILGKNTLLIMISQSGASAEIRRLLDVVAGTLPILGITNTFESQLAQRCDIRLLMHAGMEQAPSTKTYTCTLAALYLLTGALRDDLNGRVAALAHSIETIQSSLLGWAEQAKQASRVFETCRALVCFGRGPCYSVASAAAMLLQEVVKVPAHAITGGNFRHGPVEALSSEIGYLMVESPNPTREFDINLVREIAAPGSPACGHVIVVGSGEGEDQPVLSVRSDDEQITPLLAMVPIQLLSAALAESRGVSLDEYRFARKVTTGE
jgi:glutamine---fructose-6-phosphate transaminase (isomerizing)